MTNHTNQNSNTSEEIDIIQFFSYIGRGFRNFFRGIGRFFAAIFHVIILLLILIQKNIFYFIGALVLGIIAGMILENIKQPVYTAKMIVEPNYESSKQLYNQIDFFNELAVSNDSVMLARVMGITPHEASSVKSIEIEPLVDEKQKLELYDRFIKQLDTLTQKSFDYQTFASNFNDYDALYHTITVNTVNNSKVAGKMKDSILASVSGTTYFSKQKEVMQHNIVLRDSLYKKQLNDIDSLQKSYQVALVAAAKNPAAPSTSINVKEGNMMEDRREGDLLKKMDEIRGNIVANNESVVKKLPIVNVVSEFPVKAIQKRSLSGNLKVLLPLVFMTLVLLLLLLLKLNVYLKNYSEKKIS